MSGTHDNQAGPAKPGQIKRRSILLSEETLVNTGYFDDGMKLPLVVTAAHTKVCLTLWAAANKDFIESNLLKHGALLFRGFDVNTTEAFEAFVKVTSGELLEYRERSSPRTQVAGHIYSSTDYPPNHGIFLHNENSYQTLWPLRIFFFCETPPPAGGETPIADCRKTLQRIRPETRRRFIREKWMYVRNYGDGFGLDWRSVFQTADPTVVEEHCQRNAIELEWKDGDRLKTRAVRYAILKHPRTGEAVWFNHAAFFHVTTLEPEVRALLLPEFKPQDLPTNTFYGDGSEIEPSVMEEVRSAYLQETVTFQWKKNDILMADNMLVAHGRNPFSGPRRILVAMAAPTRIEDVERL